MSEIERAIEKKEYIERGALLKAFGCENAVKYGNENAEQQHNSYSSMMLYEIADEINDAPAADVEPVVRARWVPNKRHDGCMVCDQCGFGIEINTRVLMDCNRRSDEREFSICAGVVELAYCPNCGAHMERSGSGERER